MLIAAAELAEFDVLATCDQNLFYQQNLKDRTISLVVLGSNIWPAVRDRVSAIVDAVDRSVVGSFEFIEIARLNRRRHLPSERDLQ